MKDRVELNNNGLSIESYCCIFTTTKWVRRYIVCKKQPDIEHPLLLVYKKRKDRKNDNAKSSIVLSQYVGFERGFTLKKKSETVSIITKENIVILAFELVESLLQWETWLRNICGQGSLHFMQSLIFPENKENTPFKSKEIRCHLHDFRLALVYGVPQVMVLYCDVNSAHITTSSVKHTVTIKPNEDSEEKFVLSCPAIDQFEKLLEKVLKETGDLHSYLSSKSADGAWFNLMPKNVADNISYMSDTLSCFHNKVNQQHASTNPSEKYYSRLNINNIQPPPPSRLSMLQKMKQQSVEEPLLEKNYINLSRESSMKSEQRPDSKLRGATSLPEYVNVHAIKTLTSDETKILKSLSPEPKPRKISMVVKPSEMRRSSDNSVERLSSFKNKGKGRSMMDFSTMPYDQESDTRHENWKRAKKFISAFNPKSQSDIHRNTKSSIFGSFKLSPELRKNSRMSQKSSSTSALMFESDSLGKRMTGDNKSEIDLLLKDFATTSSLSETDDVAPALNVEVSTPQNLAILKEPRTSEEVPNGLVRVREENSLKASGGVNILLAKRLATSIRGSFSKYDGEKVTHHYTPKAKEPVLPVGPKKTMFDLPYSGDAIGEAIARRQIKMRESDRRASSVSFHKAHMVHLPLVSEPLVVPPKNSFKNAAKSFLTHITARNSSYSESTRSSQESLSTDARSKISIKKRNNSPPKITAPQYIPRPESSSTLVKQAIGSTHSINSVATARSITPNVLLPSRLRNSSTSSSDTNSIAPTAKLDTYQEKSNVEVSESQKTSQGQANIASEVMTPQHQGYFRKYRKFRRSGKPTESAKDKA